jgi:glycerate 2-kinase
MWMSPKRAFAPSNVPDLNHVDLKQLAREISKETLAAIDIGLTMGQQLARAGSRIQFEGESIDVAAYDRIVAIAVGKAAVGMARGFAELLGGDFAFEGILVAPHETVAPVPGFRAIGAGHPIPDSGSIVAACTIADLLSHCGSRTLIFFLLSGGGSSLIELPLDPDVTLQDLRQLNRALVNCGASIGEINAVRKHVSAVKGGRLALLAPDALKLSLAITDVPAGYESTLASGPTLPDPSTVADACDVVERYNLNSKLPASIRARFAHPESVPETPKPGDPAFARARFSLLLTMHDLFHHAHQSAEARGFIAECDNCTDDWPVPQAAEYLLSELDRLLSANRGRRVALIADGELSSPVRGDGIGGRNSAFVLECVGGIAGRGVAVLSLGTDGKDGSSPAAGAVADGQTLERARAANLNPREFAERSDSYSFFQKLGDEIETGPTGNNLRDLRILLAE